MKKYFLLRLDDACETMDSIKWNRMEKLLDKFQIKPLVGVVPCNKDTKLIIDKPNTKFWQLVKKWENKGWSIALHGYDHVYISTDLGINPIHKRSEFAGISYEEQKNKISKGYRIFLENNIKPKVFFAPSHTFDELTLEALKECTDIKIISDTIANDIYYDYGFYFIPQQSGRVRKLPFKVVTFCYHPNIMSDDEFCILEKFLKKYQQIFVSIDALNYKKRKLSLYDKFLRFLYFKIRR